MSSPNRSSPQGAPPDQYENAGFDFRRGGGGSMRRGRGGRGGPRGDRGRGMRRGFGRPGPGGRREDGYGHGDGEGDFQRDTRFQDNKLYDKLGQIAGPAMDLPTLDIAEKKFSGRNRLYIGNLSPEATEDDLKEMFGRCGEFAELFINKDKNFAFIKFDYYASCERAKREYDGAVLKGKNLKIRFAPNNSSVKVRNLSNFVSNELLFHAFSVFGEIERATVCVDERGKPTGEGIVEYSRKGFALYAVKKCTERCFFITESLRPVVVEPYEYTNDNDGFPEKFLPKRHPEYIKARSKGPRLADASSFENEYGLKWKQLIELYDQKEKALKEELVMEMEKLEAQMEYARYEHETEMLREELKARELDRDRQKQEWETKERQVDEQRRRSEEQFRRQEENMQARMQHNDEEMKRRQQENSLFMQAHQLHNMLDEQEDQFPNTEYGDRENFDEGKEEGQRGGDFRRDRWLSDRRDEFPPKRRRF